MISWEMLTGIVAYGRTKRCSYDQIRGNEANGAPKTGSFEYGFDGFRYVDFINQKESFCNGTEYVFGRDGKPLWFADYTIYIASYFGIRRFMDCFRSAVVFHMKTSPNIMKPFDSMRDSYYYESSTEGDIGNFMQQQDLYIDGTCAGSRVYVGGMIGYNPDNICIMNHHIEEGVHGSTPVAHAG